jgi:hypothetical protein
MRSPIDDVPCMQQGQAHEACPIMVALSPFAYPQSQEVDSKLTHHVAVECYKVRDPEAVKNREQQQWIFRRLSSASACSISRRARSTAAWFPAPRNHDVEEWGYECNLKLDFFATQSGRSGSRSRFGQRTPELFRGFDQRRALRRPQSGFAPQRRGFSICPASVQ